MTIINQFYTPEILRDDHKFSPSGKYFAPGFSQDRQAYIDYISTLPLIASPEVYGLHENADITKDIKDTNMLLDSLMSTQSRDSSGGGEGKSVEEIIADVAIDISSRLSPNFDPEAIQRKYPQDYYDSMSTVLVQESQRVNKLMTVVRNSLVDIQKAVKGLILMSDALDAVGQALFNGKVGTVGNT